MSILDYGGFDDEPEDEQERKSRFDDELKKYREMMNDGSSGLTSIEALEEIISYYFEHEKFEEALHFLNQLLSLVPYSGDLWQRKGLILSNLFRYDEAVECFDRALGFNPVDPETLVKVVTVAIRKRVAGRSPAEIIRKVIAKLAGRSAPRPAPEPRTESTERRVRLQAETAAAMRRHHLDVNLPNCIEAVIEGSSQQRIVDCSRSAHK